ncbi:hypothetical protein BO99DRAFT_432523 [Aspergillus violaceofuscus CBS 115571]|uniref:AA9 family lytic polysaccharide monooxygenase n=1 Tax=Aspergillus violaceofuscus (strain CBS 115571) TaxID=1450538 RepID=A0A2V5HCS0_ASPV1|nr:hypothetical protein BO99DRAFT_432523 [Aspergillus violaceofuscus CBS 115571]
MKLSFLACATVVPLVSAHYFFNTLVIDGEETNPYQYVRSTTRPHKYNPTKWINTRDDMTPDMPDFRCNKGAFTFANQTAVAEVRAGTNLALKLGVHATIKHPGPAFVYMSKAPVIHEEAVCDKTKDFTKEAWCLHVAYNGQAEFYKSCAHVKVVGGGNGISGPTVKFPGAYKQDDPSFNFSLYGGYKEYPMPGPEVWPGRPGVNSSSKLANANATTITNATSAHGNGGRCMSSFTHHGHGHR